MTTQRDTLVHVRISKRERAIIEAEKKRLEVENPGTRRFSRGDAVRSLILRAEALREEGRE